MTKTKVPGKGKASRLGIKPKFSPVHSLRSASTSLMNSEARIYHSFTTPSASPNGNILSCLPEISQGALCLARQAVCWQPALTGFWRLVTGILCLPETSGQHRPANRKSYSLVSVLLPW